MANRTFSLTVVNRLASDLKLQGDPAQPPDWGNWETKPVEILPAKLTTVCCKAVGTFFAPAGVAATVVYQVGGDPAQTITVSFKVPYVGDNTLTVVTSPSLAYSKDGFNPSGYSLAVNLVVTPAQ